MYYPQTETLRSRSRTQLIPVLRRNGSSFFKHNRLSGLVLRTLGKMGWLGPRCEQQGADSEDSSGATRVDPKTRQRKNRAVISTNQSNVAETNRRIMSRRAMAAWTSFAFTQEVSTNQRTRNQVIA